LYFSVPFSRGSFHSTPLLESIILTSVRYSEFSLTKAESRQKITKESDEWRSELIPRNTLRSWSLVNSYTKKGTVSRKVNEFSCIPQAKRKIILTQIITKSKCY